MDIEHVLTVIAPEVLPVLLLAAFFVVTVVVGVVLSAIRDNEVVKKNQKLFDMLDDMMWRSIVIINGGDKELEAYEDMAEQREEEGLEFIDPRMLFVLEQGEKFMQSRGFHVDLEELYIRAQALYRENVEELDKVAK